jgi:4-amino-4-deoxy-L-arabinose transferase-like glycosyltransferase
MASLLLEMLVLGVTVAIAAAVIADRRRIGRPMAREAGAAVRQLTSELPGTARPNVGLPWAHGVAGGGILPGAVFAVGLALLLLGQWGLIGGDGSTLDYLLWFLGLASIAGVAWQLAAAGRSERRTAMASPRPARAAIALAFALPQIALVAALAAASLFIWIETPDRSQNDRSLDLVLLWLLSIAGLVYLSGATPDRQTFERLRLSRWARHRELALLAAVLLVAAVPRLYDLSSYAWSLSGDEGTFAVTARNTRAGELVNPFSSGPWGYPSLLFIVQGWFIDLFGGTAGSARTLSALFGIGSVLAVYALVRHHLGLPSALLAALLTSALNLHVYWSRDAQDASAPMFFFPLALLLLDRGLIGGSRASSVAAGLVIALAQFFHPANRLLLLMAIAYAGYAIALRVWERRRASLDVVLPPLIETGWVALGIVIGHLPLIAYFRTHRTEFWSRTNEVSVLASGWLEREREITGDGSLEIMLRQFWNALMLPFSTTPHGHYRPGSPLVGWPLVIFAAIGFAIATLWCLRRRYFGFALAFWIVTVGLAFTDGPPMTNRYTPAAPFLAIFGAIGVFTLAAIMIRLLERNRQAVVAGATALAILIAGWHFWFYFHHPNQVELYSDANSQIANGIAHEAQGLGPGATVYLSGSPRLYYYGFQTIPFIAPNAAGIDVATPWSAASEPPELTGPTLFAFIPERLGELDTVRSWFPEGTVSDYQLPSGEFLYTSYVVLPSD